MKKPIVLFGNGKIADVIYYFFNNHSDREIVASTIDSHYLENPSWNNLPTYAFENINETHPPEEFDMFIALGYQDLNRLREEKCKLARSMGYSLASYIYPHSGIPLDFKYGDNCFVMSNVLIHPCVEFRNNIFAWSGAMIGHHSVIQDNCWLTSCCNISGGVNIGKNCFLAVNSTVANSVEIADECFIGSNTLITKCTKPSEVYLQQANAPFRLNSRQFLKLSSFSDI